MGLKAKGMGRSSVTMTKGKVPETVFSEEEAFAYPSSSSPAAHVQASIATGRSEEFQSVRLEIQVAVPCHPGQEVAAGDFCIDRCSILLKKYEDDLVALLDSLQR